MLDNNAMTILQRRYLKQNADGSFETPQEMFERVAINVASVEKDYLREEWSRAFYGLMESLDFLPNSPTLRGAGRELQQLSACFVLPIGDSLDDIHDTLHLSSLIHKTGGGTGFAFSRLRPKGDKVSTTGNIAGGPVSFMRVFDAMTQEITQGGVRMGANMGILRVDHPDIADFISCKQDGKGINNFNISVGVTDEFMKVVENDGDFNLINPRTGQVEKAIHARTLFSEICYQAWLTGDPGMIFLDTINRLHPARHVGEIESTNPCGEQPLLPYESCNLGSINLVNHVKDGVMDWDHLTRTVWVAVRFLDNVIDANKYVDTRVEVATKGTRKIGLGVMGLADALILLGIQYDSDEGLGMAGSIVSHISVEAGRASAEIAKSKGAWPYADSLEIRRNACLTTQAPTGTISNIAGVSSGIEPLYLIGYRRNTLFDAQGATETLTVISPIFERMAKEAGIWSDNLRNQIAESGSIQDVPGIPERLKKLFRCARDISPEWHVKMQSVIQRHVDSAVSKTINFPNSATTEDIANAYMQAWQSNCKGITVYRDGSRDIQVLDTISKKEAGGTSPIEVSLSNPAVRRRATVLTGCTYRQKTPLGTAYITVNFDNGDDLEPFEMFVNVSKPGSDVVADADAMGRLISLILRMPSPMPSQERLALIAGQLTGIGGRQSIGLGPNRVLSLPDAIGQVIKEYLIYPEVKEMPGLPDDPEPVFGDFDICPDCGNATLFHIEGCLKCGHCGYSLC